MKFATLIYFDLRLNGIGNASDRNPFSTASYTTHEKSLYEWLQDGVGYLLMGHISLECFHLFLLSSLSLFFFYLRELKQIFKLIF